MAGPSCRGHKAIASARCTGILHPRPARTGRNFSWISKYSQSVSPPVTLRRTIAIMEKEVFATPDPCSSRRKEICAYSFFSVPSAPLRQILELVHGRGFPLIPYWPRRVTITAQGTGLHIVNSGGSTTEYTAQFDGQDYPVNNSATVNQVAIRKIDASTVERTFKKDGKVINVSRFEVSKDGQELKITPIPESGNSGPSLFDRIGGTKDVSNPLVGVWTQNFDKGPVSVVKFEPSGRDGVHFSTPQGFGYTAQLDGKQYPAVKSRDETVSVKVIDANHVEETWMRKGKIGDHDIWVISADGREATVTDDGVLPDGRKIHMESRFRRQ
jgi:hypothetical protein